MFSVGLKLMFMGMLMVTLYLFLMVFFIRLIEIILRSHTQTEKIRQNFQQKSLSNRESGPELVPVAVLTAAVENYEADQRQLYNT